MMDESDFSGWCRRLNLSMQAKTAVERIRTSPPSRGVQSGAGNVSGAYPSRKMGVAIQFESHKNELATIYRLEHDPDVLEFYDQPEAIKLSYLTKESRRTGCLHTPDFFVLRRDTAGWEECKPDDRLLQLAMEMPNRYVWTASQGWDCPPGREHAEQSGFYYRIVSSAAIDWTLQRNLVFLEDYYRATSSAVAEAAERELVSLAASEPGINLAKLSASTQVAKRDDIFALVATGKLYVNLSAAPLAQEPERVQVFRDRATAEALTIAVNAPATAGVALKVASIVTQPGSNVMWNGRILKIVNVGRTRISFLDEGNELIELPQEHFEAQLRTGRMTALQPVPATQRASGRADVAKFIAAAGEAELETANYRYHAIEPYLCGKVPLEEPLPAGLPPARSLRRWRSAYRAAQVACGCGFAGLLPNYRNRGNRRPKLPESSLKVMAEFIENDYETLKHKTASAVHGALTVACQARGVVAPSLKTFRLAVKARPQYEQRLKREGRRKAYPREPFYWELESTTPRHGDRPFEIAHIDHTELDVELVCSRTGRNLGRPWLTLLVDAFSRRILSAYVTFDPPSYRSCMMALRICVLRYSRLPQTIVTDGGKEFASVYFQSLLAAYECTRKTRPPAKARFGAVVERLFGTANKQFVHLLIGNTQPMRNVRQVTKAINPKTHAAWTLPALYDRLTEYAYEVYDGNAHPALGQTPGEAFAAGVERGGERLHHRVAYDEGFKVLTLPTTRRGVAKVQPGNGVQVNYIYYWAAELSRPEVENSLLPVRYDPFDLSTAYVFVFGRWTKCISAHWQAFRGRSERELMLASAILHRQHQHQAGREQALTAKRLADFMNRVEGDEALLCQRDQDAEAGLVMTRVEGGKLDKNAFGPSEGDVPADANLSSPRGSAARPAAPKATASNHRKVSPSPWATAADPGNLENFRCA
jgi:putative transposase